MKRAIVIAGLLGLSSTAFAAGDSGQRTLSNVHEENGSFVRVTPTTDFSNPDSCGTSAYAILQASDAGYKERYAMALSVMLSGKKIGMWLSGCVQTPWGVTAPRAVTTDIFN